MTEETNLSGYAPSRRRVMCGVAALAVAGALPLPGALAAVTAPEAPPPGFLALSARLTGVALDQVNQAQAAQIWSALLPVFGREKLETVIRAAAEVHDDAALTEAFRRARVLEAARALTRTWYTGYWEELPPAADSNAVVPASVLFYDTALAWTVCAFTKPAANCGGVFGYWQQPWQPPATQQETRQ